jgi:hypothetical protein
VAGVTREKHRAPEVNVVASWGARGTIVGKRFASFSAFYPVYLAMHRHPTNRRLHVLGNLLGLGAIIAAIALRDWWGLAAAPAFASGLAAIGHRYFEKNRPGVRDYPVLGTLGSWRMTWDVLTGRRPPEQGPRRSRTTGTGRAPAADRPPPGASSA